ncbi:Isochorismatase hydrolase [Tricholoma matsutake]|nr:Isochorismatase hydrolase [Tricholoma matsutake 945]
MQSTTSTATARATFGGDARNHNDIISASRRVLLLLDVQRAMLADPPIGVPASQRVCENLTHILELARKACPPPLIIHVRNTGDAGEPDEPNTPGWQLIFPPKQHELVVDKLKNNAFASTKLGDMVPTDAEIVVVGFQTDYSIRATCGVALGRGNEVLLIRGAHATHDRIEVLHGGGVTPAHRIEAEIEAELEEAGVHIFSMKDLPGIFTGR